MAIRYSFDELLAASRTKAAQAREPESLEAAEKLKAYLVDYLGMQLPGIMGLLDEPVEHSNLTAEELTFLSDRGVRYKGEACYLVYPKNCGLTSPRERILGGLGLPNGIYPLEEGWRPKYWEDNGFINSLSKTCREVFDAKTVLGDQLLYARNPTRDCDELLTDVLGENGVHSMAEYLNFARWETTLRNNSWNTGNLKQRQRELQGTRLWAAALVPPDWQPTAP